MKNFFDNQSLLTLIWKWKIHFIVIGLITILLAAVFSSPYFLTPLYKSQSRLYPINTRSYSEESESEQLLEILSSTDLKRQMIDVFNLSERYGIKPDDPYYRTNILKEYNDHVDYKKTEFETIELTVLDPDPQVASDMVDSLISFYNSKVKLLQREKYGEQAFSYQNDLKRKTTEIDSVLVLMADLRKNYGLLDYEVQAEQLTLGYMNALSGNAAPKAVNEIKSMLGKMEEKGGEFLLMEVQLEALEVQRDTIDRKLDKALSLANKDESYAMIVEEAFPADKKSYPTRWLIVFVSLLATEFLALVTVISIESLKISKS